MVPLSDRDAGICSAASRDRRERSGDHREGAEGEDLDEAEGEIRELLRQRHRLPPSQDDDFTVRNRARSSRRAGRPPQ